MGLPQAAVAGFQSDLGQPPQSVQWHSGAKSQGFQEPVQAKDHPYPVPSAFSFRGVLQPSGCLFLPNPCPEWVLRVEHLRGRGTNHPSLTSGSHCTLPRSPIRLPALSRPFVSFRKHFKVLDYQPFLSPDHLDKSPLPSRFGISGVTASLNQPAPPNGVNSATFGNPSR
jgi:hypothetical protein